MALVSLKHTFKAFPFYKETGRIKHIGYSSGQKEVEMPTKPKSHLSTGKKHVRRKKHGATIASDNGQDDTLKMGHLNLNASENDPSLSEANETQSSVPASTETKAVRKAEVGVRDSNMSVLNWVFNKKETDLSTSVDPAYIERLQDDMKIACERLEEHGHESFLVTVSSAGHLMLGSAKGRQFLEERMGLVEDFIYFCMEAMPVVKVEKEDVDMDAQTSGPVTNSATDHLDAYDDDTDDNDDIQNIIGNTLDPTAAKIDGNPIKTEKNEENELKKSETCIKNNKRKRSEPKQLPKNVEEVTVLLTKMKEVKVLSSKKRSKKEEVKEEQTKKQVSLLSGKKYPCHRCGFVFSFETHLQEHNLRNPNCKDKPLLTEDEKNEIVLKSTVSVEDKDTGELKRKTIRELLDQTEAPFDCEVCLKSFDSIHKLKRHMYPHAVPKPFECIICCEPFNNGETLRKHRIIHNMRPFHCTNCLQRYDTAKSAESHQRLCAGDFLKCPVCDLKASSRAELTKHKKTHNRHATPCDVCGKLLHSLWSMIRHKQSVHSVDFPHECKICHKKFKVELTLRRHMVTHGDAKHHCEMCDYTCFSASNLTLHKRSHTGEKPFVCDICGKQYRSKPLMENHRRLHTGERPYVCDFEGCDKTFRSPLTLRQHKCSHATSATYICDICGNGYKVPGQLRHHRKNHVIEFRWPCQYCDDKFKSCDRFKTHIAKSHPDKTKEVEESGNIKFYPCTRCTRILINIEDLREHMNVHTGEKPHKCRHCGKGFSSRKNMRQHEKSHTGEQKLRCHLCTKKYSDPVAMQAHMKRLHNQEIDTEEVVKMEEMIYANPNTGKKTKGCYTDSGDKEANRAVRMLGKNSKRGTDRDMQKNFIAQHLPSASQLEDKYEKMEFGAIPSHSSENSNEELIRVEVQPTATHMMLNFDRGPAGVGQGFSANQHIPLGHSVASRDSQELIFPLVSQEQDEGLIRVSRNIIGNSWTLTTSE